MGGGGGGGRYMGGKCTGGRWRSGGGLLGGIGGEQRLSLDVQNASSSSTQQVLSMDRIRDACRAQSDRWNDGVW